MNSRPSEGSTGWMMISSDPAMAAVQDNLSTLDGHLPAPCLGVLPHGLDPVQAAERLDVSVLLPHR